MEIQKLFLSLVFIFTLSACSSTKKTTDNNLSMPEQQDIILTTPSGVTIKLIKKGDGLKPSTGDKITVHYKGRLTDGTVFDSSFDRSQPFSFTLGTGQVIQGWDDAFAMMQTGDQAEVIIPPALGYGSQAMGKIPANSTLIFNVELLSVKQKITATPYAVYGLDTNETKSGLKYIMVKKGAGKQAAPGTNVSVHYTGYLTDGSKFDSSVERGEPITFRLGEGRVIQGWEQGIALLNVGGKARLIIPYNLGYGEQGYPPVIPSKATLVFDVELVDVN